ncbi:MAG: 23S rRNA (guanosine(2251)-2'-O)-methyltransferase RlmB [Myxococcales bacterium]|nr:23S rRNA (guanosine(2251)-2'-O)-methyltransferase RlmB [Myxococcales bacterium]
MKRKQLRTAPEVSFDPDGTDTPPDGTSHGHWLHGVRPVLEALEEGAQVSRVWLARDAGGTTQRIEQYARNGGIPVKVVPKEALDRKVGQGVRHQGVVAERTVAFTLIALEELVARAIKQKPPLILLLDGIMDPGNLGAILRSAHVMGASGVVLPQDRIAPLGPVAMKTSAGTAIHVPIARVVNLKYALEPLTEAGFWTAAAVMDGQPLSQCDLDRPIALVIGNEEKGVRPSLARKCDIRLTIPMRAQADSLNVSVASGILIYEILRQRRETS